MRMSPIEGFEVGSETRAHDCEGAKGLKGGGKSDVDIHSGAEGRPMEIGIAMTAKVAKGAAVCNDAGRATPKAQAAPVEEHEVDAAGHKGGWKVRCTDGLG
jgi:hypothetical protein